MAPDELEDLSLTGLFAPQPRRAYFAGPDDRPFTAWRGDFRLIDAWWLAEASLLAYVPDRETVARALAGAGFADPVFLSERSTHAFVAGDGRVRIVVFRGTEHLDIDDLRTDFSLILDRHSRAGHVHRGFRRALDLVWPGIAKALETGRGPVFFAGHSLGAALATLAAARYDGPATLYTYGSPRVGDADFRDAFPVPAYRVVNLTDLVCQVPPPPYRHVGVRCYLGTDGFLHIEPGRRELFRDEWLGARDHGREVLRRWVKGDFRALPSSAIVNHSPRRYADRLRAALR